MLYMHVTLVNSKQPGEFTVLLHKIGGRVTQVNLDRALLCFPNLGEENRGVMKSILQGRPTLKSEGLEVIKTLDRLLTLPFNVSTLTYLSYQCHLAIIGQMAF